MYLMHRKSTGRKEAKMFTGLTDRKTGDFSSDTCP